MEITFLKASKPLVKEISKEGSKPYPLVKDFTSSEENISIDKTGFNKSITCEFPIQKPNLRPAMK